MGSFAASVDVPEQLRPWAGAGLSHLYLPDGLDLAAEAEVSTAASAASAVAPAPAEGPSSHASAQRPMAAPGVQQAAQGAPGANLDVQHGARPSASNAPTPAAQPEASARPASGAPAAPPEWPEPWRGLAARVRSTPRVIITYAALADDVSGAADPVRRKLFLSVLSYLGWPQGTTLFWPISFPTDVDPGTAFASDIFAAGVRHFGIRHVLCFGPGSTQRARTLFPQDEKDVIVHAAPAPEALAALLPHELHQALAGLKAISLP